jgi:hypothetical protein
MGMNEKGFKTRLSTHIDEIGPSFGKVQLGYERDRLSYLCANGLFVGGGKSDHRRYKSGLESILVRKRDGVLILKVR